jgi:multidrug efflux system outer membrane protein
MQTENVLAILAGGYPRAIARRAVGGASIPVPPQVPAGLPAQLLERRPDVRAAENQLHAAVAQIGVAEANRFPFPTIGLTAALGVVNPKLADLFSGTSNTNFTSWGPAASIPLLDFGRAGANYDSALAQARLAEASYRATVLQSVREVSDALVASEQVVELIAQNQVRVTAGTESLRLTRLRYRSGVANYLEVLDGERQLFAAEIDLARANLSRLINYAQLYRALGGGWSDEEIARLQSQTEKEKSS